MNLISDGRVRVMIEGVKPEIDGGRFAIKRVVGEKVVVEADLFCDGHDSVAGVLLYRMEKETEWTEVPMEFLVNDRWRAHFVVSHLGRYRYTLQAWVDWFTSWRKGLEKKIEAKHDVSVDLLVGAELVDKAGQRARGGDAEALANYANVLRSKAKNRPEQALSEELVRLMAEYQERRWTASYGKELPVVVDREKARFSTWYELFPRSCAAKAGRHGTFKDCEGWLPYVAGMGFDVLYFPPIHPIGRAFRKGKNNALDPDPEDVGSPWAIGSKEGGHKAIHPQLGTLEDFKKLVAAAAEHGLEVAMDLAFQCTPDHPYVKEHPEWFRKRPDGTVQYAENPPKKYQDIYPLDFECDQWRELWDELKSIVHYWIGQGIRIFRVDNPHTKAYSFWEELITEIKADHPETLFLAEAFTRPKVMGRLAKVGFSQSYTYFTWRNTKWEFTQYLTELTRTNLREYLRPNFWPNTPDILPEHLQFGGRPAFMARLVMAATMTANYGIYGPAFELCENRPREPRTEEYLNSEKYEIKEWNINSRNSLREFIARVNRIRKENPALQSDWSLRFHNVDNDHLLCYSKETEDRSNIILTVVNLDFHRTQAGWVDIALESLGLTPDQPFQVHDLLTDAHYVWQGARNFVQLDPSSVPAHIYR
ncbi:MAG TPA: alpha-1,4-glucan--maltose-1-phosphate maltosyltransferase, partial [Candidatus Binatia bacterium]